jgi:CRP/FNR family cyclic AMP-dependent transcriptional regulator
MTTDESPYKGRNIMETLHRILAEHPFFSGLEERYIELLVGCASNVRFDPGQTIFREGEEADRFYVLRHGKVALQISGPPHGSITVQTLGEGDILGWSWLLSPYRWKFSAKAGELTRAIALDGECLRKKSEEDHDLGYELLKRFAQVIEERLLATRLQLVNVYEVSSQRSGSP